MLREAGILVVEVPVGGRSELNVALVEPGGRFIKVNASGDPLTREGHGVLTDAALRARQIREHVSFLSMGTKGS